ncbi:hypothetical protein MWT96_08595 [Prescottella equi]|uniref:Uncharacterized protein n=2 Tax=Rhodococcus hoagii TaxID=43767 RepID=E9T127_RHOHA|nr:hypothetical protein [Prescottella equi]EGD24128.1 hypothetical protein HMPREF0724_12336 [Prescottella equi ATCC 33707]MBM4479188.1 hypothetical protein [Prescottella equi]MBM4489724.1 hypothetical protein [Prescottella equi]MBM4500805.1 hypothetical protein [Prescottella equi]MBM4502524.1 hypothetical protein [Prescottella equi]
MTSADEDLIQQMRRLDGLHDTVDLTVGGQAVDYPTRYVLSRAEAEEAVRDLGTGDLRAGRWERQSW